jgi:dienelactone hydrolase
MPQSSLAVEMIRDIAVPRRGGALKADIVFPTTGGPYPVIIFSHGSGGTPYVYRELTSHWAAAGFVVIAPMHADSRRLLRDQGLQGRDLVVTLLRSATDPAAWQRRVGDVTAILDLLPRLASVDPRLARRADPQRVGVGGHSYGAFTAMLTACARPRTPSGAVVDLRDPRPDAFLLLSAQGAGQQGLEPASWSTCERPMMVVSGTEDRGRPLGDRPAQTWREKLEPFRSSPPGGKVGWVLQGAAHSSFVASNRRAAGDLGPAAERDAVDPALQDRLFATLAAQTTLWWRAQLTPDEGARAAVASGVAVRQAGLTALYKVR